MQNALRYLALCAPMVFAAPFASANVLTFDDLASGNAAMPSSYSGLSFSNWFHTDFFDPAYPTASGTTSLYTAEFGPSVTDGISSITSANPFVFDGAFFSGFSGVTFKLYLNGVVVHVSSTLPDGTGYGPTFLSSGYAGAVDKIVVSGIQGYFAMDDFIYQPSAVPEPQSLALWLAGIGVVGVLARNRRATR